MRVQTNRHLEAARQYAELGYRVFPCGTRTKTPATKDGFHSATTDRDQIERWWTEKPNANIAIATEGLLVVDIDAESTWLADEPRCSAFTAAPLSLTANGGKQFFFRQPVGRHWRCTVGKLAPHVDTRADGGYVVVPPSQLAHERVYRWASGSELAVGPEALPEPPDRLAQALDRLATCGVTLPCVGSGGVDANAIPEGQRNATLARLAGTMRRVGMSEAEIRAALLRANADRCSPPLNNDEVGRIAWSVSRYAPDNVSVALTEDHWNQMTRQEDPPDGPCDPGNFPPHLLDVPGFITDLMRYNLSGAFKPQPVLALGAALALLGTLTGRKVTDAFGTRTNIYCLGVCQSGGGKERARQVNKDILHAAGLDPLIGPEGIASHAGLVSAVECQPAILFQLDEIGRMLRTLGDPGRSPHLYHIATVLMKLFTSSGTVYVGDAYADSKRNKTIYQPHVCLYGTTVPQSLYEGLTTESLTDGFLSRMLIFESDDHDPEPQVMRSAAVHEDILDAVTYWAELKPGGNLSSVIPQPSVIEYTPEASAVIADLEQRTREERRACPESLATLWTRTTEKARKLALLYACSREHTRPHVDEAGAAWASELSEHITRKMMFVATDWVAENHFEAKRKRLLREIRAAGDVGLTRTQLYRKTKHLQKKERADLIESLIDTGDVHEQKESTAGAPRWTYRAS